MLRLFTASTDIADISPEIAVSEYRKNKIDALRAIDAKNQSRAATLLLSYALRICFGIDESRVEYALSNMGKPYFPQYPDIHFNISHTDGAVAVAISDKPVGVDIERLPDVFDGRFGAAVARRFFSEAERMAYGITDGGAVSGFYRLWTAKESAVKCNGKGIANGHSDIEIPFFEKKINVGEYNFTAFTLHEHIITVCAISHLDVKIENVTAETLLQNNTTTEKKG